MYAGARTSQRMTSLKTMLVIQWSTFQGLIMHLLDDADQAQDRATYNCPWVNVGLQRSTPTMSKLCPCTLLIVIVKARVTGNWKQ
jgi:hypothetical protein